MSDDTFILSDFTGGFRNVSSNPLATATQNTLWDGLNVICLKQGGLQTRPGSVVLTKADDTSATPTTVKKLRQVFFPRSGYRYLLAQIRLYKVDVLDGDGLFFFPGPPVSNPTNDFLTALSYLWPTWAALIGCDYGDGYGDGPRCSIANVNDRAIITYPGFLRPLVWAASREADGSDWAYPVHVMVCQSGDGHHYDITDYVVDDDTDRAAPVGSITSDGWIIIFIDVPFVNKFRVEIGTANTINTGTSTPIESAADLDPITNFSQMDLKATIDHWVQDSGATGHFENAANTPLTLGAGNNCPDVEVGLRVTFSDSSYAHIEIITDDGEGSGEVTLDVETTSKDVSSIVGMESVNGVLCPTRFNADYYETTFTKTATNYVAKQSGYYRQIVAASELSIDGRGRAKFTWTTDEISGQWPRIYAASVMERSGATLNGVANTLVPITFDSGKSYGYVTSGGLTSDPIIMNIDEAKDYLVCWDTKP